MNPVTIVLDAGHTAGCNVSPVVPSYVEGNRMWVLCGYLKTELETRGIRVICTRSAPEEDLPVVRRGLTAAGADLFLSLHSNACASETVRRVVAIPTLAASESTSTLSRRLAEAVSDCMGIRAAYEIYQRPLPDDASQDYYGVLRGAVCAGCRCAMILEHSFHSNKASALWLNDDGNLRKLAVREAEILAEFFRTASGAAGNGGSDRVYRPGDFYRVRPGDVYTTGTPVAAFAVGQTFTVKKVASHAILLKEINSWIAV